MEKDEILKVLDYAKYNEILNLSANGIRELPSEIGRLTHLTRLSLKNNELTHLPEAIGNLVNLEELWLDGNQLRELPESIGKLKKLRWFSLRDNQLFELPKSISELTQLEILELKGNPLPGNLSGLSRRPQELLAETLRLQERQQINEVKMVVLGPPDAGKSAIIRRLIERQFTPENQSTSGIVIQRWPLKINQQSMNINVWDFGSETIINGGFRPFLSAEVLYLLVWDAAAGRTREELGAWLRTLKYYSKDAPVIVALNKVDSGSRELDRAGLQKIYPNIRAFINVSARTEKGFSDLRDIIRQALGEFFRKERRWEPGWFNVRTRLEVANQDLLTLAGFRRLCARENVDNAGGDELLRRLDQLGVLTHFGDDIGLRNTIILNAEWAARAIDAVLHQPLAKDTIRHPALVDATEFQALLNESGFSDADPQFLLNLLIRFGLCFPLEDHARRQFLIPARLGPRPEGIEVPFSRSLNFQFHYNYLPKRLLPRVLAKLFYLVNDGGFWDRGMILENRDNHALIESLPRRRRIAISIGGRIATRREFLAGLRQIFNAIHNTYPLLEVREVIPADAGGDAVFDYSHLLTLEENGVETLIPEGQVEPLQIVELLRGRDNGRSLLAARREELQDVIARLNETIENHWLAYAASDADSEMQEIESRIRSEESRRGIFLSELTAVEDQLSENQ